MRLIKPQGGATFVTPFYENWKATCCQIAFRCGLLPSRDPVLLLYGYFRSCLSINSLGYCSVSQAFIGRPSEIAE